MSIFFILLNIPMKSTRRPYILIREFKRGDDIARKELIKQYVMSFAFDAFLSCLFREVTPSKYQTKFEIFPTATYDFSVLFPLDFRSIDSVSCGCDVYFFRSAIAHLSVGNSICDYISVHIRVFDVFHQRNGIGKCE